MKQTTNLEAKASTENLTTVVNETPKAEKKKKKDKKNPEAKEDKKKKKKAKNDNLIQEVKEQQKVSILEEVISKRQVKYIYPEDVTDTLSRKNWRQKTRNELHRLELKVSRIKDTNSKEYKKALAEYEAYKAKVLKPEQVA